MGHTVHVERRNGDLRTFEDALGAMELPTGDVQVQVDAATTLKVPGGDIIRTREATDE